MSNEAITYKDAGVDTKAGQTFVRGIKQMVQATFSKRVLGGLGGFSAAYDVSFLKDYREPVLLSGADGVGTKLEIARLLDKHDTVGIDLVAMCVNDILVSGGQPLYFLDYISCGKLQQEKMSKIVSGIVKGCQLAGASLVGGETAEHPGVMAEDEYDLAGFVVGAVEKENIITGETIEPGDVMIGLESSGPHSNGFSLLRKLYLPDGELPKDPEKLTFIAEHLMKPTKIYVQPIVKALQDFTIKGMVHITGGGFWENIPRILPEEVAVTIEKSKIPNSYVFSTIQEEHGLHEKEMFSTFNMGVGFVLFAAKEDADALLTLLNSLGEHAFIFGHTHSYKNAKLVLRA